MKEDEVRLECLKLCHRIDKSPENVIIAARWYEDYILGTPKSEPKPEPEPQKVGKVKTSKDKLGILD